MAKEELEEVLSRVNLILKSGGLFFVSVRKGSGEKTVKHEKVGKEEIFTSFFTKEELEDYLKSSGFEIMNSYIQDGEDYKWVNIFAKKV